MNKTLMWLAISIVATLALSLLTGGKALVLFIFLPLFWSWRRKRHNFDDSE